RGRLPRQPRVRPAAARCRIRRQHAVRQTRAGVPRAGGVRVLMRFALAILALAACGTNQTPQPEPVPVLPDCVPDRDGELTADELPIALGATLTYYAGVNRTLQQHASGGIW